MKVIGLTGASGSGKGEIAKFLAELGALIIDADKTAHRVILSGNPAFNEILEAFGTDILDGNREIDRKKLGGIVFSSDELREKLVKITHKYIVEDNLKQMEAAQKNASHKIVVFDAPLLLGSPLASVCDEIWVVSAEREIRISRIMCRDKLSHEQVLTRIDKQIDDKKAAKADVFIENNDSTGNLRKKVASEIQRLLE